MVVVASRKGTEYSLLESYGCFKNLILILLLLPSFYSPKNSILPSVIDLILANE